MKSEKSNTSVAKADFILPLLELCLDIPPEGDFLNLEMDVKSQENNSRAAHNDKASRSRLLPTAPPSPLYVARAASGVGYLAKVNRQL